VKYLVICGFLWRARACNTNRSVLHLLRPDDNHTPNHSHSGGNGNLDKAFAPALAPAPMLLTFSARVVLERLYLHDDSTLNIEKWNVCISSSHRD
jgi:hypothetical protein